MALQIFNWMVQTKEESAKAIDERFKALMRPFRGWGSSAVKTQEVLFQTASLGQLYDFAEMSDTYRTIKFAIQRELFRNGAEWTPKFGAKCSVCEKEFDSKPEQCTCGCRTLMEPDMSQRTTFDEFIEKANDNGHSLLEVMEHAEPDLEVLDNAYILILKQYVFDDNGEILSGTIKEIMRGDPLYMRKIIDRQGRPGYIFESGLPCMVCPEHRDVEQIGRTRCGTCNKMLYPAYFKTWNTDKTVHYFAGECIHLTKYTRTLFYGFPPALTVMTKIRTLLAMDNMMNRAYFGQKTPKAMFMIKTSNVESMTKEWEAFLDRAQKDPFGIYPMFVPSTQQDQGKLAEYFEFMRSPEEMQFIETRTELKQTVGALFGVMPIFQADLSTSSGLNNEGLTITVTTRAIESGQKVYNDKVFPFLLKQFGVTDWEYKLKSPEEKDQMAEEQLRAQRISNAQAMQALGFEVMRIEDEKFIYSDKPEQEEAPIPPPTPTSTEPQPPARLDGAPEVAASS